MNKYIKKLQNFQKQKIILCLLNFILLMIVCEMSGNFCYAKPIVLENGQKISLFPDGTWEHADYLPIEGKFYRFQRPPFQEVLGKSEKKVMPLRLEMISETTNDITDDEDWFKRNQINFPNCRPPANKVLSLVQVYGEECSTKIPRFYREKPYKPYRLRLVDAFFSKDNYFLVYGDKISNGSILLIADRDLTKMEYILDFKDYIYSRQYLNERKYFIEQDIDWADKIDNILYIAHSQSALTAINLDTSKVLWRSRSPIFNAKNFLIVGDVIIAGYGGTGKPDFLYQINRLTGEVLSKLTLKTAPAYIVKKDDKIFVRTYDTDYVFQISDPTK